MWISTREADGSFLAGGVLRDVAVNAVPARVCVLMKHSRGRHEYTTSLSTWSGRLWLCLLRLLAAAQRAPTSFYPPCPSPTGPVTSPVRPSKELH